MVTDQRMQIFDVRPGAPQQPAISCYNHSVEGCERYGRPECRGELCDQCPNFCWKTNKTLKGTWKKVWPEGTPAGLIWVYCQDGWQSIWSRSYASSNQTAGFLVYEQLQNVPLQLRVTLMYADGSTADAYFLSFSYKEDMISVGGYSEGKAGNFWESPFTDRAVSGVPGSNCLPFFYPQSDKCSAGGVDPSQDVERGYAWVTNDIRLDNTRISEIILWVRRREPADPPSSLPQTGP